MNDKDYYERVNDLATKWANDLVNSLNTNIHSASDSDKDALDVEHVINAACALFIAGIISGYVHIDADSTADEYIKHHAKIVKRAYDQQLSLSKIMDTINANSRKN